MSSLMSNITAIRVSRERVAEVSGFNGVAHTGGTLDGPGIYLLLVGKDDIYVGQSSHDSVGRRILNAHSGTIDHDWHTVIGFVFSPGGINSDELLYLENAMCEYVYRHFGKCLTATPSRDKCNERYRNDHYGLNAWLINNCKHYIKDMEFYLSCFPQVFPDVIPVKPVSLSPSTNEGTTVFCKTKDGAEATAIVNQDGKITVLEDSRISPNTTPSFPESLRRKRNALISGGTIVNNVFVKNWTAPSVSTAAGIVMGRSANGRTEWKTADGSPVGNVMK